MTAVSLDQTTGVTGSSPPAVPPPGNVNVPLILDLDGTLIRTDLLFEATLSFLLGNPLRLFLVLAWLWKGIPNLKRRIAERVSPNAEALPWNELVVDYARREKARGREVYIASAADAEFARIAALQLGFISAVIATENGLNMKGEAKARVLRQRFSQGFEYVGDAPADLAVFAMSSRVWVVEASAAVERAAIAQGSVAAVLPRPSRLKAFVNALRLHQWAKNVLVFVPLVLSGLWQSPEAVVATVLAFVALGIVASATYLVNDLWDIASDRQHWSKKHRSIASGRLPILHACAGAALMLPVGLVMAAVSGMPVLATVMLYLALTLAYSFALKRVPLLDGAALAGLFTLRLAIGVAACGAVLSSWLFLFSLFFFASLSFAKRHTEVSRAFEQGKTHVSGRGYRSDDIPLLLAFGIASGLCSVLIMVLYVMDDASRATFAGLHEGLWAMPGCLALFLGRIWLVSQRGELDDDPVLFAVRDPISIWIGVLMSLGILLAIMRF